jgi:hypothetical protein
MRTIESSGKKVDVPTFVGFRVREGIVPNKKELGPRNGLCIANNKLNILLFLCINVLGCGSIGKSVTGFVGPQVSGAGIVVISTYISLERVCLLLPVAIELWFSCKLNITMNSQVMNRKGLREIRYSVRSGKLPSVLARSIAKDIGETP